MHRGPLVFGMAKPRRTVPCPPRIGDTDSIKEGNAMDRPRVRIYTDYKSPYAFVANKRLFELEEIYGVELEWLPYTLRIPEFMGTVEERTPHFWRKVRYLYMDARRFANAQGLTLKGTRRVYDAFYSSAGMLFAQRYGFFRCYHETVFRRFWNHQLELDELPEISAVIEGLGGSATEFEAYVSGDRKSTRLNSSHSQISYAVFCLKKKRKQ